MALGYEGWATLNVNGTEDLVLCTGASVPETIVRLESNSGYGGQIKTPASEIGIGFPHAYDWSAWDGSVNFEVTKDVLTNQIKPWLFDRQKAGIVTLRTRRNNLNYHSECFWNSIGITCAAESSVECALGFVAVDTGTYTAGGGFLANKTGDGYLCNPGSLDVPDPLVTNLTVPGLYNAMIPGWKTTVTIDGTERQFISWSLNLSQDIVKFFACESNSNPQEPKFLAAGPMTVTFSGEYMFIDSPSWSVPNYVSTLNLNLDTVQLNTKRLERNSTGDDVVSGDSPVPVNVEYTVYELVP